jgi:tRNA U38,U39,U40 pseudouridine synthase TruA
MNKEAEKKPDLVVFNEETQSYDAALKPYGTSASSPVIKPLNTATWRNDGVQRVNKQFKSKFDEVRREYEELIEKFQYNDLVYNSKFNFEPNIGEVYHLYNNRKEQSFLSIIAPEQCSFHHLGSFRLNTDKMWEKLASAATTSAPAK